MEGNQFVSLSPSFNSYSAPNRAQIAARVVEEFLHQSVSDLDSPKEEISDPNPPQEAPAEEEDAADGVAGDDDFEFAIVCRGTESSPISADEIFSNGQIKPVYPLFNQDLLFADERALDSKPRNPPPIRLPLGRLMMEDRDPPSSCSSSEAEELEGVPAETYCVWNPTVAAAVPRRSCKKSSSTGTSSKRWTLRSLLFRSNSDGKDSLVFLAPSLGGSSRRRDEKVSDASGDSARENIKFGDFMVSGKSKPAEATTAAEEADCGNKKKESKGSFLPYKEELVGFFSNMNGLSRNVHPF